MFAKVVKKSVPKDKRDNIEDMAGAAQEAADMGQMKAVYNITRELSGTRRKSTARLKDQSGQIVDDPKEQAKIWTAHFQFLIKQSLRTPWIYPTQVRL